MIQLKLVEQPELSEKLRKHFYDGKTFDGQDVCIVVDGDVKGLLTYSISDAARIKAVAVDASERKKGYGDFITRSMMNTFTLSGLDVVIEYEDKFNYFDKFGFVGDGKFKRVSAENIVFPSKCKH